MIVELNAFGLTKLVNIDENIEYIEMTCQQRISPQAIEHIYPYEISKRVVFKWFGEYNHDNIKIYYLDSIK